ncbi:MAG: hypothetical protein IPP64_09605 [Bacteroidetes bacterium]|nr:hypothetical protein [Bacteroidota bacterium]
MKSLNAIGTLLSKGKMHIKKMINTTFFIIGLTLLASCNFSNDSGSDVPLENGLTVEKIQRRQSSTFLEAGEMCMSGFVGDTINVHGVIKNTSPEVTYKDAVVKVTYYSDAKIELGSKQYTIHEVFSPLSDVNVEFKVEKYKDVNTIDWEVIQASAN